MRNAEVINTADQYLVNTYGHFPVVAARGKNATLWDLEGNSYIDFTAGIGVNALGWGDEDWADAVAKQALEMGHCCNLYYAPSVALLAKKLAELSGMKRVFFGNSGAEANEGAIKLARKYSADRYGPGRSTIVTLWDSFHGRTVTTLSATGQDVFHQHFFPFTEGFVHIPANDTGALQKADDGTVCAVMLEAVQGEGGVKPIDAGFVRDIFRMAEEKDWLVIFDEVQSGLARTGKRFGFDHFGVRPDIITLAKALAGGLPLGAFLCNEKTENTLGPGSHASTFGGNPVSAAAALVVLDKIMNEAFYREVGEKGDYIRSKVISFRSPLIGAALGLGLMIGFQVRGVSHKALCGKLAEKGLLTLTAGSDVLRFLPPLTISYQEIDAGLEILKKVLDEEGKKR